MTDLARHPLAPLTALGGPDAHSLRHGDLLLTEVTDLALASLALGRAAEPPMPHGLTLPEPGGWSATDQIAAFWTGPDQWMIEGPGRADSDFAADIAARCPGCPVTEQTDGFAVFEITASTGGSAIEDVMAKLVNIDPTRLPAGSTTRTGLEHMSVFVIRRAPDRLAILGMRSAAGTLWHALEKAVSRRAS